MGSRKNVLVFYARILIELVEEILSCVIVPKNYCFSSMFDIGMGVVNELAKTLRIDGADERYLIGNKFTTSSIAKII